MAGHRRLIWFVAVLLAIAVATKLLVPPEYFSLAYIDAHRRNLADFIDRHYLQSVLLYFCLFLCTAFFLPGALALTVAGGMFFGTWHTVLFVNIASLCGALVAFEAARHLVGKWVQERFGEPLARFNAELDRHGSNYLLTLRVLPVLPFCVVNYIAGLTRIRLRTFVWTTSLGMFPGSFIYAFAGERLGGVGAGSEALARKILPPLVLLTCFVLLPVALDHWRSCRGRTKKKP